MKKAGVVCAMGMVTMLLAGCGPSNPLIGEWKLQSGRPSCETSLKFTSDEFSRNGETNTIKVTYNVSPKKVYVITNAGINFAVGYDIADSDHMSTTTAWGTCSYSK